MHVATSGGCIQTVSECVKRQPFTRIFRQCISRFYLTSCNSISKSGAKRSAKRAVALQWKPAFDRFCCVLRASPGTNLKPRLVAAKIRYVYCFTVTRHVCASVFVSNRIMNVKQALDLYIYIVLYFEFLFSFWGFLLTHTSILLLGPRMQWNSYCIWYRVLRIVPGRRYLFVFI